MFKVIEERIVRGWPVTIRIPMDGGHASEEKLTLDFLILDTDNFAEVSAQGDRELLKTVIKGWSEIGDADGHPLPFTEDNLNKVVKKAFFAEGAFVAYLEAQTGRAKEKN